MRSVPPTVGPRGGAGDSGAVEVVNVDYRDVLDQAVSNARYAVLRELQEFADKIKTRQDIIGYSYPYRTEGRSAEDAKSDIQEKIRRMMEAS